MFNNGKRMIDLISLTDKKKNTNTKSLCDIEKKNKSLCCNC